MAKTVERGSASTAINAKELEKLLVEFVEARSPKRMLLLPPDHTRLNSMAGPISAIIYKEFTKRGVKIDLMPALGTHAPMTEKDLRIMFGESIPLDKFLVHDWRNDVKRMGTVSKELISEWSEGKLDYEVAVETNKALLSGYDLVLSIGQVVPHEVVGMANYTKNVMVGVGGSDTINKSHFLGAVYNMERIMGRTDTPVRKLFNYGVHNFLKEVPLSYVLTVMAKNPQSGAMEMKGLYCGDTDESFAKAAELARQVNLQLLDKPLKKVVSFLDPDEFTSTWLGNKSVYRTRMAIADEGELVILAPGLKCFGEDKEIDRLIRKYGYKGTPATLKAVKDNAELRANLGAAAHLIHGSSEGRFKISYCPGPGVSKDEILSAGFGWADLEKTMKRYDPKKLKDGLNVMPDGEEVFYISNPALGLWALREKFV